MKELVNQKAFERMLKRMLKRRIKELQAGFLKAKKVGSSVQQIDYGIRRNEAEFILKLFKEGEF